MKPSASLFIDNFALQDAAYTILAGLDDDERPELGASSAEAGYEVKLVSSAGIQVEALLQILNTIVLQDELVVEAKFAASWDQDGSPLKLLRDEGIVFARPLNEVREEWLPIRECVEEELCFSPQLAKDFTAFRKSFKGESHPIFSTLLWGTAGMIARSQYLKRPYLGHPSRGRVIGLGQLGGSRMGALDVINRFVSSERVKLFDRISANQTTRATSLSLPPVALEVISACHEAEDLIPTAIQLRDDYRNVREWIGEFQQALERGSKDSAKSIALLEAAAADVDRLFKGKWWARFSFDVSLSLTSLPHVGGGMTAPIGAMVQRILPGSVRTAVTKLIQQFWDDNALDGLFRMLGGVSPEIRAQALRHLRG